MPKSLVKRVLGSLFHSGEFSLEDISESDNAILRGVKSYTMTSPERVYASLEAVRYVIRNQISGSIVECGVWRGGTMMAIAQVLRQAGSFDRDLYLFDTFEGMPIPSEYDVDFRGRSAGSMFRSRRRNNDSSNWCYASLPEVQSNLEHVGYDKRKIHYIVGRVEDTIPTEAPAEISVLRLDTDWYESTKHELIHLFPRLVKGGVLIIDDYGHWLGAKRAVDEYFDENQLPILLNRVDYTGRLAVKI